MSAIKPFLIFLYFFQIPSDENLLLLIGSREAHGWKVINRCALLLDKAFVEYCQELATLLPVGDHLSFLIDNTFVFS